MPSATITVHFDDVAQVALDTFVANVRRATYGQANVTVTQEPALPPPDFAILAEIERLVEWSERLFAASWQANIPEDQDSEALTEAIEALDGRVGEGLRPGRYLDFSVGDGDSRYIITEVAHDQVKCELVDEVKADAVDAGGWCLRSIAEAQIAQRDRDLPIIL